MVEAVFSDARLVDMVAAQNLASGELGCWLEIEFKSLPSGVDPTDVRVRFESIALVEPADFDWSFISQHDVVTNGGRFGSGYRDNEQTSPASAPPLEIKRATHDNPSSRKRRREHWMDVGRDV